MRGRSSWEKAGCAAAAGSTESRWAEDDVDTKWTWLAIAIRGRSNPWRQHMQPEHVLKVSLKSQKDVDSVPSHG